MHLADLGVLQLEILGPNGRPFRFAELSNNTTLVVGFVRHFGCIFCHEQATHLKALLPSIESRRAKLVIIGNGTPEQSRFFMQRMGFTENVYTDPARLLYRAFGMRHGPLTSLNLAAAMNGLRAYGLGHRQRQVQGDPWQQGGTLVISKGGEIIYRFLARVAGDEARPLEIIGALDRSSSQPGANLGVP